MALHIISYGAGINSTALLIELVNRKQPIDLILFADTGGERPHTYQFVKKFSKWLVDNGAPEIITVKKGGIEETLEENCLRMKMLPSLAYGFKGCSHKYKIEPQNKYCNNWQPAKNEWAAGRKVIKYIGYDADEDHRAKIPEDKKYRYIYPLVEWGMGREDCIETIENAGLCLPGKSACFFCPSSKIYEIHQLAQDYPELAKRAITLEKNAELTQVKGLGRNFSWGNVLSQQDFIKSYPAIDMTCGCYDG